MRAIYLDYNATTPIAPSVLEVMLPFFSQHYGNPSSNHFLGRAAHHAIEDARVQVADLLRSEPDEIIFTSGGTESNNLAILGSMLGYLPRADVQIDPAWRPPHVVISSFEHPAVTEPVQLLEELGAEVDVCPVDRHGVVSLAKLESLLRPATKLVSIMHANNEIGTLQPIRQIANICRRRGVLVHTDAAQSVGKVPAYADDLDVDLLSLAGHKIYASKGVGALYIRHGTAIEPFMRGAAHEAGLRPGTEATPLIVGLGAAARLAARGVEETMPRLASLRDQLWGLLNEGIRAELIMHGQRAARLPNTLSVRFPGVSGADLLAEVPEICASTGSACHSGDSSMTPTLRAIGVSPDVARGTVRFSVGWQTSQDEIERAASLLIAAWERLSCSK